MPTTPSAGAEISRRMPQDGRLRSGWYGTPPDKRKPPSRRRAAGCGGLWRLLGLVGNFDTRLRVVENTRVERERFGREPASVPESPLGRGQ